MANTKISDVIDPVVFADMPAVDGPEKTALYESGIIIGSPKLDEIATMEGKTAELPYWNDLDGSVEVNYSSDASGSSATPQKITQGEMVARKAFINQGWSSADLVNEIALGQKAMDQVRARVDRYFARQFQRRMIAAIKGVLADNIANDAGDMVIKVASESVAGQSATTKFNRSSFSAAVYTLGDAASNITGMAVHSVIMQQMVDNNDVVYIPDSQGQLTIPTYLGLRVVVDDQMPVVAGTTDGFKYTTALFGNGAIGYGNGAPTMPVEIEREAAAGDGGGIETLWVRKTWIVHPFGFKNIGTPAGVSFTLTELANPANWDRVYARKNVPMAFLVTN